MHTLSSNLQKGKAKMLNTQKNYDQTVEQLAKMLKNEKLHSFGDDRTIITIKKAIRATSGIGLSSDEYAVLDLMEDERACDVMENFWYDEDWYPRTTCIKDEMLELVNDMRVKLNTLEKARELQKGAMDVAAACESSRYQSITTPELNMICDPLYPNKLDGWAGTLKQRVTDTYWLINNTVDELGKETFKFRLYLANMTVAAQTELGL